MKYTITGSSNSDVRKAKRAWAAVRCAMRNGDTGKLNAGVFPESAALADGSPARAMASWCNYAANLGMLTRVNDIDERPGYAGGPRMAFRPAGAPDPEASEVTF